MNSRTGHHGYLENFVRGPGLDGGNHGRASGFFNPRCMRYCVVGGNIIITQSEVLIPVRRWGRDSCK